MIDFIIMLHARSRVAHVIVLNQSQSRLETGQTLDRKDTLRRNDDPTSQ